jgi:hypothetical protein
MFHISRELKVGRFFKGKKIVKVKVEEENRNLGNFFSSDLFVNDEDAAKVSV